MGPLGIEISTLETVMGSFVTEMCPLETEMAFFSLGWVLSGLGIGDLGTVLALSESQD